MTELNVDEKADRWIKSKVGTWLAAHNASSGYLDRKFLYKSLIHKKMKTEIKNGPKNPKFEKLSPIGAIPNPTFLSLPISRRISSPNLSAMLNSLEVPNAS